MTCACSKDAATEQEGVVHLPALGVVGRRHAPYSGDLRYLLPVKNNLAPMGSGISYRICATEAGVPHVEWIQGVIDMNADEVLTVSPTEERSAPRDCAKWLSVVLSSGPKPAKTVVAEAEELGFTTKVLRRARERLGIDPRKSDLRGGWIWELPG